MQPVRVAVYGASLMMAVLEASLRTSPHLVVIRLDPARAGATDRLSQFAPQVIIVDEQLDWLTLTGDMLLCIDQCANNQAALLNRERYPIQHLADLQALIQQTLGKPWGEDETEEAEAARCGIMQQETSAA